MIPCRISVTSHEPSLRVEHIRPEAIIGAATYACYAHNRRLGMSATGAARIFGARAGALEVRFQQSEQAA